MTSFAALKKNRKKSLEILKTQLEETAFGKQKTVDERFWNPTVDKVGNGYAVIRFLPPHVGDIPYIRIFSHWFKGPTGQWYVENSRSTIDEPDPVGELNTELWNNGQQDEARKQKRRLHFISNILVIKDSAKPENEGKVFLFKYGKKIFEKLNGAMNPEYEDEEALNPFDMWDGANFQLKIRKYEGFRNYDKSGFTEPSPIAATDKEIENIWKKTYNIDSLISPDNFKSYDDLKKRLNTVLGLSSVLKQNQSPNLETSKAQDNEKSDDSKSEKTDAFDLEEDETDLNKLLQELNED